MLPLRNTLWSVAPILVFALTGLLSDANAPVPRVLGQIVDDVGYPTVAATIGDTPAALDAGSQAARAATAARGDVRAAPPGWAIVANTQREAILSSAAPQPMTVPAAAPASVPAPAVPVLTPAPAPASCPADWFCYPRVGIAGPVVPYTDCSGASDVGTAIRSFTCLSSGYLMGHAYTSFGAIVGWQAGDAVFAFGKKYTITGALKQSSCAAPVLPLAPLSMQTSLSPNACGPVLVVQAQ
jgi:hypothetical protein